MTPLVVIERKLWELLGMRPRSGATAHLDAALKRLRSEHGLKAEEVAARLDREPWLVRRLAAALTVEETYFRRHPKHFDALTGHLRACLCEGEQAVVWSAGCASGEEPYSMAMAIHRGCGPEMLSRTKIIASDVSEVALSKARRAAYGAWSFRGTSDSFRATYFTRTDAANEYHLLPAFREAVEFQHRSLDEQLTALGRATVDAIFFRNVAIYLTADALARVYAGFSRVLKEDGLLIVGPSDPPPPSSAFARMRIQDVLVHRRLAESSRVAQVAAVESDLPIAAAVGSSKRLARAPERLGPSSVISPQRVVAEQRAAESAAHKLADRGLTGEALSVLDERMARYGTSAELLGLRGRIHLAAGNAKKSVLDLRAALDLQPMHVLLRFHYALGLEALHDRGRCCLELKGLLQALEGRSEEEALVDVDGPITVGSLRVAARELLRRME